MKKNCLFGSVASAMLLCVIALTSCVQDDMYEMYDDGFESGFVRSKKSKDYGGSGGGSANTNAQNYVSTGSNSSGVSVISYMTKYSYNKLCKDLSSYTSNTTFSSNEISFVEVYFKNDGTMEPIGPLTPESGWNITAHKEYSGAVFTDDKSGFIAFDPNQTLTIYFVRSGSSYSYAGYEYKSGTISHKGNDYKGYHVHTHPNGTSQESPVDENLKAGGLTVIAIPAGCDDIKRQANCIRFK